MDILYLLAAVAALLSLQALAVRRFAFHKVGYTRSFSKEAAFAGESVEMVEVLRNAKPLPLPWVRAESRMSPQLRFTGAEYEPLETGANAYHRSAFFLGPFAQVTRRHRVTLGKRGRYEAGSVTLTAGDLFGLAGRTLQFDTGAAISVYPRLLSAGELDVSASRWQGDLLVRRWIAPDPFWVAGIRAFTPGDSRRDIHWPATARVGALQVKARDFTAAPKLLILLNVQMDEHQWSDLMEYEQAAIEQGISLAATLLLGALSSGVEAGVAANAPMGEGKYPMTLLPARYAGRDTDLLEALARLRILRVKNFHTFIDDLGQLNGLDILILSAYDSPLIQERMAMLRRRGNAVAVRLLEKEVCPCGA